MKTKYYMIALAAMTMTLGSCSDSENTTGTEAPKSITVSTSIGTYNKDGVANAMNAAWAGTT